MPGEMSGERGRALTGMTQQAWQGRQQLGIALRRVTGLERVVIGSPAIWLICLDLSKCGPIPTGFKSASRRRSMTL